MRVGSIVVSVAHEFMTMWVSGDLATYTQWRNGEQGFALAKAVIAGECEPGILADWCDENQPTSGVFTPEMANTMRWAE